MFKFIAVCFVAMIAMVAGAAKPGVFAPVGYAVGGAAYVSPYSAAYTAPAYASSYFASPYVAAAYASPYAASPYVASPYYAAASPYLFK